MPVLTRRGTKTIHFTHFVCSVAATRRHLTLLLLAIVGKMMRERCSVS
jgi:hypothetical protein